MRYLIAIVLLATVADAAPLQRSWDRTVTSGTPFREQLDIVPSGKRVFVKAIGCVTGFDGNGIMVVEWGSGTTWTAVWACAGATNFEVARDFAGDGTKRLRVTLDNGTGAPKRMFGWLEAYTR